MEDEYLPAGQVIARLDIPVSASTLRLWANAGRIRVKRPTGKRFYHLGDVQREMSEAPVISYRQTGKIVGYARVSSSHQKEDLERQVEYIQKNYQVTEVIKDIGSGLNYNRRGFDNLLTQVEAGAVSIVVVTYKDRMCRFGLELVERIFDKHGTKLVILCNQGDGTSSVETELAQDLLDVCNYFVAKRNGQKAAKYREERNKEHQVNQEVTQSLQGNS
jgi:putative resolvase